MIRDDRSAESSVVVVGGINVDTILRVERLPAAGETVLSHHLRTGLGGKAANQAVAIARTGTPVRLLAAVGADDDGTRMTAALAAAGVDVDGVRRLEDASTGRAMILVDDAGENVIVVTPGANGRLTTADITERDAVVSAADVLVVQGEVPTPVTVAAVLAAHRHGVRVVVNLAPYVDLGAALAIADPVVVNEIEASQLLGRSVTGLESADVVGRLESFARSAVVTIGADGALVVQAGRVTHVPAVRAAQVVDTTGAGDAFVGALAAALAAGFDLEPAAQQAVRAATASVQVTGAGDNYPEFDLDLRGEAIAG